MMGPLFFVPQGMKGLTILGDSWDVATKLITLLIIGITPRRPVRGIISGVISRVISG